MPPPDYQQIDSLLRLVDREVWIVTSAAGGQQGGLTATWVASASIDRQRPVLLAGVAPNHHTGQLIRASGSFVAHLVGANQTDLAFRFAARSGYQTDKFESLPTTKSQTGSPILEGCVAWFDCRVFARYDAGDRWFFWGDVIAAGSSQTGPVLREHAFFGQLSAEQRQQLIDGIHKDLAVQRPMHAAWRESAAKGTSVAPKEEEGK